MKRLTTYRWLLIFLLIFFIVKCSYSQDISAYIIDSTGTITCGTPEANKLYKGLELTHKPVTTQELIDKYGTLEKFSHLKMTGMVYQVVFQVVHNGEPEGVGSNISDAQVHSAMIALNNDFRNQSAQGSTLWSVDTQIQFCLASEDPFGNPTSGIVRHNGSLLPITNYSTQGIDAGGPTSKQLSNAVRWDVTKYINIFVVTEINDNDGGYGIQAYAYYPTPGINPYDGIYQLFNTIGTVGTLKSYTDKSTVLPHEMGHVFFLYHTFEAYSCTIDGDLVADTPPTTGQSSNNLCNVRDCGGTQQIENFMDYTHQNCQCGFTNGQKQRMWAAAGSPQRAQQLANTTCVINPGQPDFLVSNDTLCVDEWVQYGSVISGATSLSWTMTGGYYSTSTSVTAYNRYSIPGTYQVKLKWNNDSIIKQVTVIDCPPINSIYAENHFGDSLKLKFTVNKGAVLLGNSKMHGQEAQSGICDANGNLICYTNSRQIYNSNHTLIANNLNGSNGSPGQMSSSQSLTIDYLSQQFVFVTSDGGATNLGVRFYNVSNPVLQQATFSLPTCEGITAVRHGDGIRWWIIYKIYGQNQVAAYLFDGTLSTAPVISLGHDGVAGSLYCVGQIKANRDGKLVVFSENSSHTAYVYNFDRCDGTFDYWKQFFYTDQGYYGAGYGATFDHTGDFLYTDGNLFLIRWNLATSAGSVIATGGGSYSMGQLMTAPPPIDTVYVARTASKFLSSVYNTTFTSQGPYAYSPYGINIRYGAPNIVDAYYLPVVCGGTLPIELISFTGSLRSQIATLEWSTATETNNDYFILEKLILNNILSPEHWTEIVQIKGAGNSNTTLNYSFKDYELLETNYYRLSQYDYDGNFQTFKELVVIKLNSKDTKIINVYDILGRKMFDAVIDAVIDADNDAVINSLPKGFYIIQYENSFKKIVK